MSDRIAVMYLGKIVELGPGERICGQPAHPYTRALISAIPAIDPVRQGKRIILQGEMPSSAAPPAGCPFHPRCPFRIGPCDQHVPLLEERSTGHWVACHRCDI